MGKYPFDLVQMVLYNKVSKKHFRFFEVEWNIDGENRTVVAATKIRMDPTYIR